MADYYEPIIRNGVQVGERLVPDTSGLVIRRRYRLSDRQP